MTGVQTCALPISKEFAKTGGLFEMVQLWVNLPAKDKMTPARYQAIESNEIPVVHFADDAGQIRVIAGTFRDVKGPASTFSSINVWDGQLKAEHSEHIHVPMSHTVLVVVLEGELLINGTQKVQDSSIVLFEQNDDPTLLLEATQDTKFLVLTGEPLNEPIQGYGPFVMNTKEEIVEAFNDFNHGKFGTIPVQS